MAKAKNKTQQEAQLSVDDFIASITDDGRRKDCQEILEMMERLTGEKPAMWGGSIVGFGFVTLHYGSKREVDWFRVGFAPRKANISLYLSFDIKAHGKLLEKLGKHKTGQGCLYINKLTDIDLKVLETLTKECLQRAEA